MTRLLIAISTIITLTAAGRADAQGARWIKLDVSSYGTISYDASHVQRKGNTVTVVMRYDYARPSPMPDGASFDRRDESVDFDCEDQTYHEMSRTMYSGNRELRTADMSGSNFFHIRPGTVWAKVAGYVCK
jgi:hypothetical protein